MLKIAIIVALPDEWRGLKRLTGPWRKVAAEPCRTFVYSASDKIVTLMESGMGGGQVQAALAGLQGRQLPQLILSCGFAGALSANCAVGDIFWGQRLIFGHPSHRTGAGAAFEFEPSPALLAFCRSHAVRPAPVITVEKPQPKPLMARIAAGSDSLMDMESYLVAEFAQRSGIPLVCLRAVSDGLADEIDYDLDAITDAQGRVQPFKVLRAVLSQPRLVRSFYHSWQRSRRAARRLGEVLSAFLGLSAASMQELLVESHLFTSKQA